MSKNYQKKTSRSRRKLHNLDPRAVQVDTAKGKASFQLRLPLPELMEDMTGLIEQTCSQVGLLMIKGLIDEEVESLVGGRYAHDDQRQGYRWGTEEGSIIFAGRKVAIDRPRVRSKNGGEIPLHRYAAFRKPTHMEKSVQQRILRCVSMRDYEGVLEPLCDGYGIDKSSVSRHWKAASAKQMRLLMERPLGGLSIDVLMIDGKGFGDYTVITALGIDTEGRKHVLGLWSGATENAVVCGQLLDELIERGLPADQAYLFVLDGSAALSKAVKARFGERALIQRCYIHKKRNILKYLPKKYHRIFLLKWNQIWVQSEEADAKRELSKVRTWLKAVSEGAFRSLEEAGDQLLMVYTLKLSEALRRSFRSTNLIENVYSRAEDMTKRVKHWRNENMVWRWSGAVLLRAEKGFKRVRGYKELAILTNALAARVDGKQATG